MKPGLLLPCVVLAVACGGGAAGPRGVESQAGAAGSSFVAGAAGASTSGAGSASGGVANAGSGGSSSGSGGTGGAASPSGGSGSGGSGSGGPLVHPAQRTVVYLPAYRGSLGGWAAKLDYSRVSYVNVCFADVDAAGNVAYSDATLDTFVAAAHAKGVKVCMAIGGATVIDTGGVFASVLQDGMRDTLVDKLGQYATQHQLDCIDVDLEGNGVNAYYEAFVTSLASKLHTENKQLTAAVSSWFGDKISDQAIQAFDFINVMAYDLHNPGGSSQPVQSSSIAEAQKEVDYWVGRGLAKDKAVFGVPFYGYRWSGAQGEALTYSEILAKNPAAASQDQVEIDGGTVFLNSRTTIAAKAVLAKSYGGIMAWELGQDAAGDASLLKAIADASQ